MLFILLEFIMKAIKNHVLFSKALSLHKLGLTTGKDDLNASFGLQISISKDLRTPLYDVMMAIRSEAN